MSEAKEEPECVLEEPSGGRELGVGGEGSASMMEKEGPGAAGNVVVPDQIDQSKNGAEGIEKKRDGEDSDMEGSDAEQTGNAVEDGGASTVKEEKSDPVDHQVENGGRRSETDVKVVQPRAHKSEETPVMRDVVDGEQPVPADTSNRPFFLDIHSFEGDGSGTEEEQNVFMKELENFHKVMNLEFKPPKFYGEGLNCLKLWRAVTRLGGYDQVTTSKLWRQVGESFHPPKTCTTISWSFRCFYEKALLEYEKHKILAGELQLNISSTEHTSVENQVKANQPCVSGRTVRDAAARAMQGWHSQRLLGNGEVGDPIIKDKSANSLPKRDKHKSVGGIFKRKKPPFFDHCTKVARPKGTDPQMDSMVDDIGPPADWVKINVRRTKDCFEVYVLVPGLLREEVHVQSDAAGRLVISGEPEQLDNPWGITPFKKIITLPSRIDPHQTSAVVTLHGQLFVRAPFEKPDL